MFLSNNSSFQYCTDQQQQQQQQQQQPMYVDRQQAAFLSDVSPNSSSSSSQLYQHHYPAPQCPHNQSSSLASSFHFPPCSATFIDHNYEDYYFSLFLLQQQQQQHQDLLVGNHHHHFSQQQQQQQQELGQQQQQDHHNQPHLTTHDMETSSNKVITTIDNGGGGGGGGGITTAKISGGDTIISPWKRASKKDRHSKIVTAQGPRDRRMRLSLDIARRFFKLQDMLKFDKASKTVEWLLTNSRSAIKELSRTFSSSSKKNITTKGSCSTATSSGGSGGVGGSRSSSEKVSSVSECEVVCDDQFEITNVHEDLQMQAAGIKKVKKEKRKRGAARKASLNPPLAKESREKARARARERTIEKMRSRSSVQSSHQGITICTSNQLRSSSSFETGEESGNSQSQDMRSSLEMIAHEADDLISSHSLNECRHGSIVEESFVVSSNSTRSSLFDYDHEMKTSSQGINMINNNCNFSENWDFHNARAQCNYYSMPNNTRDLSTDFQFIN